MESNTIYNRIKRYEMPRNKPKKRYESFISLKQQTIAQRY